MNSFYSIIIPVHNEARVIPDLLNGLKYFSCQGHEIIIIDDGSTDESRQIINNYPYVKNIHIKNNIGKGAALKKGIEESLNEKIIIYDGDMELKPQEISKLMILDKKNGINAVMGYRFNTLNPIKSSFSWGNFMFTSFFNIIFNSQHKDILCCAKAFYINDIKKYNINSNGFDIDVELSFILSTLFKRAQISQISLDYVRRTIEEGKKLKVSDGWIILLRIIKMIKYL